MGHHNLTGQYGQASALNDVRRLDDSDIPRERGPECRMWVPSSEVSIVGNALIQTDMDFRTAAGLLLSLGDPLDPFGRRFGPSLRNEYWWDLAPFLLFSGVPPISREEGHIEVERGARGQSFESVLVFVGILEATILNLPATMTTLGSIVRRVPFRVTRRGSENTPALVVSGERAGRSEGSLLERALAKRTTYRWPDGTEVIVEEFSEAAR